MITSMASQPLLFLYPTGCPPPPPGGLAGVSGGTQSGLSLDPSVNSAACVSQAEHLGVVQTAPCPWLPTPNSVNFETEPESSHFFPAYCQPLRTLPMPAAAPACSRSLPCTPVIFPLQSTLQRTARVILLKYVGQLTPLFKTCVPAQRSLWFPCHCRPLLPCSLCTGTSWKTPSMLHLSLCTGGSLLLEHSCERHRT